MVTYTKLETANLKFDQKTGELHATDSTLIHLEKALDTLSPYATNRERAQKVVQALGFKMPDPDK